MDTNRVRVFSFDPAYFLKKSYGRLFWDDMSENINCTQSGAKNKVICFSTIFTSEWFSFDIQKLPIWDMRTIFNNFPSKQRIYPCLVHWINRGNFVLPNNCSAKVRILIENNEQVINGHNGLDLLIIKLPDQMAQKLSVSIRWRVIIQ